MKDAPWIAKSAIAMATVLTIAIVIFGVFIAFIGVPTTQVQEYNPSENTGGVETIIQQTSPHGLIATLAALLMLVGLMMQKLKIAWVGLAFLFTYSVLFLFSTGALLLPIDIVLLILLVIIQLNKNKH